MINHNDEPQPQPAPEVPPADDSKPPLDTDVEEALDTLKDESGQPLPVPAGDLAADLAAPHELTPTDKEELDTTE